MIAATNSDGAGVFLGILYFIIIAALYAVPTIVVLLRKKPNPAPTIVVNMLLGWTFIGWVVALAMAFGSSTPPQTVIVNTGHVATPAGWYPDPERPDSSRWWDGYRWADPV